MSLKPKIFIFNFFNFLFYCSGFGDGSIYSSMTGRDFFSSIASIKDFNGFNDSYY